MKKADFLISGSNSDISLKYLIFWVKVSIKVFFKKLKLALIGLHRKYIFFRMNMNVFAMLERFFFFNLSFKQPSHFCKLCICCVFVGRLLYNVKAL